MLPPLYETSDSDSDSEVKLFLQTDNSVTYHEFRANFLANFAGACISYLCGQTICYIISGLRDRTINIAVLYSATTVVALKQLVPRYVQLSETNCDSPISQLRNSTVSKTNSYTGQCLSSSTIQSMRCVNCFSLLSEAEMNLWYMLPMWLSATHY